MYLATSYTGAGNSVIVDLGACEDLHKLRRCSSKILLSCEKKIHEHEGSATSGFFGGMRSPGDCVDFS